MQITVKPVGYLRVFFKDYLNGDLQEIQLCLNDDAITIRDLLAQYKFDLSKVGFLILNEKMVKQDCILKNGDRLVILPMLAGG